jgi:small-conductance mechanosensitive channel
VSYVVKDKTFKPGDRVVVCTPAERGQKRPAWRDPSEGKTGTVREWVSDDPWMCWLIDMDDGSAARFPTGYLKPHITCIEDVEQYLAAS